MDRDERMVLEQRVRAGTVERHRAGHLLERIRREEHQRKEEEQDRVLHERGPGDERVVGTVAETPRRDCDVHREQECPQEDRALERRPRRGERVEPGRRPRDVVGDVGDREVVAEQCRLHDDERADDRDEHHYDVAPAELEQRVPPRREAGRERGKPEGRGDGTDREQAEAELCSQLPRGNGSGGHWVPVLGGL